MYKNFNITESEKEQILNRLKENGYRQPLKKNILSEQGERDNELDHNPIGELANHYVLLNKDKHGIFYLLRDKNNGNFGVYNRSSKSWQPGYEPTFVSEDLKLYQTDSDESVLMEKYVSEGGKVFYTMLKIDGDDSGSPKVDFLDVKQYNHIIEKLKPVDTDEPVNNSGFDDKYTDSVYEENGLNEGKQILINTFKRYL